VVKVIWHEAASPPHTNYLIVFSPCGANVHPHLTHGSFGPRESDPKRYLNRFFRFAQLARVPNTHRHDPLTTQRAVSVAIGRIHVMRAMWTDINANASVCGAVVMTRSSPSSSEERRLIARRPVAPSVPAVCKGCYCPRPSYPIIIITRPGSR